MESSSKEKFKKIVREHKIEISIVGGTIIAIGLGYFGYKYIPKIKVVKIRRIAETVVKKVPYKQLSADLTDEKLTPTIPNVTSAPITRIIDVREHLRNLPNGYHPSELKLTEASNLGIELLDNQTIVSSHSKCYAA